jgi:hypothetical protein
VESFFAKYPEVRAKILTPFRKDLGSLDSNWYGDFNALQRRIRRVDAILNANPELSDRQIQSFVDLIVSKSDFSQELGKLDRAIRNQGWLGSIKKIFPWGPSMSAGDNSHADHFQNGDDIFFVNELSARVKAESTYIDASNAIKPVVVGLLKQKLGTICQQALDKIGTYMRQHENSDIDRIFKARKSSEEVEAWKRLRVEMQKCLSASRSPLRLEFYARVRHKFNFQIANASKSRIFGEKSQDGSHTENPVKNY